MNGLDAWISGPHTYETVARCECPKGHVWMTPGYIEYGGFQWADEERGPVCPAPRCGRFDIETHENGQQRGEPLPGYIKDSEGVFWIPEQEYDEGEEMITNKELLDRIESMDEAPCKVEATDV
jgi:hypothetical protein